MQSNGFLGSQGFPTPARMGGDKHSVGFCWDVCNMKGTENHRLPRENDVEITYSKPEQKIVISGINLEVDHEHTHRLPTTPGELQST